MNEIEKRLTISQNTENTVVKEVFKKSILTFLRLFNFIFGEAQKKLDENEVVPDDDLLELESLPTLQRLNSGS